VIFEVVDSMEEQELKEVTLFLSPFPPSFPEDNML
jgi:hypothetical protein